MPFKLTFDGLHFHFLHNNNLQLGNWKRIGGLLLTPFLQRLELLLEFANFSFEFSIVSV
jgi:hypothetical protein